MFSHNDNDSVNGTDPTGGQTAYDFRTDRIFSDPKKAAEFQKANVQLAEAIFVKEWKTEGGSWWADTGLSVLQKTVQGVVIAPLAIGIVGPVIAAAPAVGSGLGVLGLGASIFQTASDISNEGLTPDNTADTILTFSAIPAIRALLGGRVTTPARSTATGSAAVNAADEITEVTQTTSQAVCKKCESLDLWAADRVNAEYAIGFNDLMNSGASRENPFKQVRDLAERVEVLLNNYSHPTCTSAAFLTQHRITTGASSPTFVKSNILAVRAGANGATHDGHAIVEIQLPGNPEKQYLTWGKVYNEKEFLQTYGGSVGIELSHLNIEGSYPSAKQFRKFVLEERDVMPRIPTPEFEKRERRIIIEKMQKIFRERGYF
jgi:hypothetical protein